MLNIISINVNGLRAYYNKNTLGDLIQCYNPDILCLQETKADEYSVDSIFSEYGYITVSNSSKTKKGYAGVSFAIKESLKSKFSKDDFNIVEFDQSDYFSGRIIELKFKDFDLINVYMLNSGSEKEDLRVEWNRRFNEYIKSKGKRKLIITGDFNVVSTEKDYWSDFESAKDSGPGLYNFEIDHFHDMMKTFSLVDTYRKFYPNKSEYTWFSYRTKARENNRGWRIDYFLASNDMIPIIKDSKCYSSFVGSDHSPIQLLLDYKL